MQKPSYFGQNSVEMKGKRIYIVFKINTLGIYYVRERFSTL
jgi:hypothetical protein